MLSALHLGHTARQRRVQQCTTLLLSWGTADWGALDACALQLPRELVDPGLSGCKHQDIAGINKLLQA